MSDQFLAEIRPFACSFAPVGWAFCDGQLLPISQNTALFSLLGTTYGGDGRTNFALPNLQGAVPLFYEQGPGLSVRNIGEHGGESTVTLQVSEIHRHTHHLRASSSGATANTPTASTSLAASAGGTVYGSTSIGSGPMAPGAVQLTGGGQPHNNMMPYQAINFCIALSGIFPPRNS